MLIRLGRDIRRKKEDISSSSNGGFVISAPAAVDAAEVPRTLSV